MAYGDDGPDNDSGDGSNPSDSDRSGQAGPSRPGGGDFGPRGGQSEVNRDAYDGGAGDIAAALMGWNAEPLGIIGTRELVAGTRQRAAANMSLGGMSDRDISQALSGWGASYSERARMLGPIDAISQGPFTNALSGVLSKAASIAAPQAGLLGSLADRAIKGNLTGDYGDLGSALGGLTGSQLGGMMGMGISETPVGAIAGMALGGLAGSAMGRAIGSGQGQMSPTSDLSANANRESGALMRATRRPAMVRQPMQQPMMSPSVALQLLGMRGFGV